MMKKGMPMRGERTAKHKEKEAKGMTSKGMPMGGKMPPMYGGKMPTMKKGKK